jgi:hypothetical protein
MVARAAAMRTVTRVYRVTGSTLGSSPDVAQAVLRSTSRANFTTVEEASKMRAQVPGRKQPEICLCEIAGKAGTPGRSGTPRKSVSWR